MAQSLLEASIEIDAALSPKGLAALAAGVKKAAGKFGDNLLTAREIGNLEKQITKQGKSAQKNILKALKKGVGSAELFEGMVKNTQDLAKRNTKYAEDLAAFKGVLDQAGLKRHQKRKVKSEIKSLKNQKKVEDRMEKSSLKKDVGKIQDLTFDEGALKGLTEGVVGGIGDAIEGGFNNLKAGDLAGFFNTLGSAGEKVGGSIQKAGEGGDGGAMTEMAQSMGGVLKKFGKAALLIGVVAGAVASLAKMLIDADAQAKEFNNTILQTASAADLVSGNFSDIGDALEIVRGAAVDFRNNLAMGTTADEQIALMGAFEGVGYTIREIQGDAQDGAVAMERLQQATSTAVTYSRLIGMSMEEVAQHQGRMVEEMGLTIGGVAREFSGVMDAAVSSGFGVNRFYSTVLQATSGMALYNVRLSETAGLLLQMGKILGSDMGADFVKNLNEGFADEGYTQRFQRGMLAGLSFTQDTFARSAEDTAAEFVRNLADRGGDITANLAAAASGIGLEIDFADQEHLVEQLRGLSSEDQAALLAETRVIAGGSDELTNQLRALIDVSEGSLGGLDNIARNMHALDAGGVLAMQLNAAAEMFSDPIHLLSAENLAGFESMTGVSGQQLQSLLEVSEGIYGSWDQLERLQADVREGTISASAYEERSAALLEQLGATVDEQGNIIQGVADEDGNLMGESIRTLEGIEDFVQSQGDALAEVAAMGEEVGEDVMLAREISQHTQDIARILEVGVTWMLEQIYGSLGGITRMMLRLPGINDVRTFYALQAVAVRESSAMIEQQQERVANAQDELLRLEEEGGSEEDIAAASANLDHAAAGLQIAEIQLNEVRTARDTEALNVARAGGSEEAAEVARSVATPEQIEQAAEEVDRVQLALARVFQNIERGGSVGEGISMGQLRGGSAFDDASTASYREQALVGVPEDIAEQIDFTDTGSFLGRDMGVGLDYGGVRAANLSETDAGNMVTEELGGEVISQVVQREQMGQLGEDIQAGSRGREGDLFDLGGMLALIEEQMEQTEVISGEVSEEEDRRSRGLSQDIEGALEDQTDDQQNNAEDLARETARTDLAISLAGQTGGSLEDMLENIDRGENLGTLTETQAIQAAAAGVDYDDFSIAKTGAVEDFIYRGSARGGMITPIDSRDELLGMRPGGAVDSAGGGGGRGGGGNTINITVNGGDQREVYETIRRVMERYGIQATRLTSNG